MQFVTSSTGIIEALACVPGIVIPMVREADPAIVKCRPPSGKWSIHEHACHVASVHPMFFERLDLMLSQDDPVIRSYDPGRDDPEEALLRVNLDEALTRFERDRALLVDRLRRLPSDAWRRTGRHDEYNSYSVTTMFRHVVLHDFFHAYRIEELLLRKDWPAPRPSPASG
jgi:uncharacterized damage-inducible protein DinB